jgi:steroid delta-isomerase-like uncharacterized protein
VSDVAGKTGDGSQDARRQLAERWAGAWSGRTVEAFAEICTPDVHYEDPLTPIPLSGPEALGHHAQRLWDGVPDTSVDITGPCLGDDRHLAIPCRVTGTHSRWLEDFPPSNRPLLVHAVAYCQLADGRLRRVRAFYDLYDAAIQLGVLPKHGTLGDKALMLVRGFGLRGVKIGPLRSPRLG